MRAATLLLAICSVSLTAFCQDVNIPHRSTYIGRLVRDRGTRPLVFKRPDAVKSWETPDADGGKCGHIRQVRPPENLDRNLVKVPAETPADAAAMITPMPACEAPAAGR